MFVLIIYHHNVWLFSWCHQSLLFINLPSNQSILKICCSYRTNRSSALVQWIRAVMCGVCCTVLERDVCLRRQCSGSEGNKSLPVWRLWSAPARGSPQFLCVSASPAHPQETLGSALGCRWPGIDAPHWIWLKPLRRDRHWSCRAASENTNYTLWTAFKLYQHPIITHPWIVIIGKQRPFLLSWSFEAA